MHFYVTMFTCLLYGEVTEVLLVIVLTREVLLVIVLEIVCFMLYYV